MPILKSITLPNHAVGEFHVARRLEVDFVKSIAMLSVLSYPNEAAYLAGAGPIYTTPVLVPATACAAPLLASAEVWLTAVEESIFAGGVITTDQAQGLEAMKMRQWDQIKVARDAALAGGMAFDGSMFDSDPVSISRITGAAMLAMMAVSAATPYKVTWVLADNTTRELDAAETMALGAAAGAHVQAVIDQGQALRGELEAATTIGQVAAVAWPIRVLQEG